MRLKSVKLTNFRGYRATTVIPIDEAMTGIVGRNDYGKSTILEALAIFFEADGVKVDKNDMNCFSQAEGEDRFDIACEFEEVSDPIVLDENVQTSLAQELLLNRNGALEVVKVYKANTAKLEMTAIRCEHPTDETIIGLLGLRIADLRVNFRLQGVFKRICTVADYGLCGNMPDFQQLLNPISDIIICYLREPQAFRLLLILPTQIGYDSDHAMSDGEVGRVGVAIDSLKDMEILFNGIDLQKVSTSMTINATAPILLAMYISLAKKQGADLKEISGTIQNDILKQYAARGTYIYPPKHSMRLITDVFEFCSEALPK